MRTNMGAVDRMVRVLLAVLILGLYISDVISGAWGIVLVCVSALFTLTGFTGTCPLYSLLGLSTRRT